MTFDTNGITGMVHSPPAEKSIIGSGEITPWSTSISWHTVMSNSSATSERRMCHDRSASPLIGGNARGPRPSSAIGYSSAHPSAYCGQASSQKWSK